MLWSAEVFTQKPAGLTQAVYAIKFSLQLEGQGRKPSKRTKSLILSPCKECFCPFVSCPVHRLCSPPSICSHRRGAMKGKAISILPAHRRSRSMGAELKSCILMRCCCATRAEQSRSCWERWPWGAEPARHKFLLQAVSSSPVLPPGQQLLCLFCFIHTSCWASHTFLVILPNICSQFVSNSSLCSSLPDSGHRVKFLCRPGARGAGEGTAPSPVPSVGQMDF